LRDSRFDLDNNASYRHRLIEAGRRAATEPWFVDLVAALCAWSTQMIGRATIGEPDKDPTGFDEQLRTVVAEVNNLPTAHVALVVRWWSTYGTPSETPDVDWAWGTALAQAGVMLSHETALFDQTWRMVAYRPAAGEAYLSSLAHAFNGEQGLTLHTTMTDVAMRIRSLNGCDVPSRHRDAVAQAIEQWRETAKLPDVWNLRDLEQFGARCDEVWLLDALRRHDRRQYLNVLEEMSNPLVVQEAMRRPEVAEDADEIQRLLEAAPIACTDPVPGRSSGNWNNRITPPLVLAAGLAHAEQLVALLSSPIVVLPPENIEGLVKDLTELFGALTQILLNRDDGAFLVVPWLVNLAHRLAHEPYLGRITTSNIALAAVARALVDRNEDVDLAGIETSLSCAAAPVLDVMIASLAVQEARITETRKSDESTRAWNGIMALLEREDANLTYARGNYPPSLGHAYAALPLTWAAKPDQLWSHSWSRLAEQRNRAFYSMDLRDLHADETSLFLLYIGLAALHMLQSAGGTNVDVAARLGGRIYDAGISVVLRLGTWFKRHGAEQWRQGVVALVDLLSVTWQAGDAALGSIRLDGILAPICTDDELLIEIIGRLHHRGVSAVELHGAISRAGSDLDSVLSRYTGFRNKRHPVHVVHGRYNAVEECRHLLREVDGARTSFHPS